MKTHLYSFITLIYFYLVFVASTAIAAAPSYTLETGQWHQLVIPGESSTASIESLFADDLPADQYNSSWYIYRWDDIAGEYINPGLSGSIPTGQGFWMIQTTGTAVELDIPPLADAPLTTAPACPSSGGCSQVQITANTRNSSFVMIGSALSVAQSIDSIRLVTDASEANCTNGCSHSVASELGLVQYPVWRYNPDSGSYENLAGSGSLGPWESAWFQTTSALEGVTASYYFPTPATPAPTITNGVCQDAPPLPTVAESDPGKTVVRVSTETELRNAVNNVSPNTVVLIEPGLYELSRTLVVRQNNVTLRGNSNRCDAVRLVGMGMDNAAGAAAVPHGIWTDADSLKIQNLTIENVYNHSVSIDSQAAAPEIYNVAMFDAGEQFVKVNAAADGQGSSNGRLEYSIIKYTNGPPVTDHGAGIGYTQGISLHSGDNWVISNNRFENLSTPDTAAYLWNPAVLAWNSSSNTVVENNLFIDVDRAIALGLQDRADEHSGGIIRNNMVLMRENLYSQERRNNADATILVWSSPDTQVLHNTVLTNGNTPFAIEIRFNSNNAILRNNLTDAPIRDRSSNQYVDIDNVLFNDSSIFRNPAEGDLHLASEIEGITDAVPTLDNATQDFDRQNRSTNLTDAGADEYRL